MMASLPARHRRRLSAGEPKLPAITPPPPASDGIAIVLRPDPSVWDGSFANNAWLQECPKPITKQVWGNSLALHPTDAGQLGFTAGEVVTISVEGRELSTPVLIEPGMPVGVGGMTLGLGRSKAGAIGNGVGANAYAIRTAANPWTLPQAAVKRVGRREEILTTQNVVRTPADVRELYPVRISLNLRAAQQPPVAQQKPSLLPRTPTPD